MCDLRYRDTFYRLYSVGCVRRGKYNRINFSGKWAEDDFKLALGLIGGEGGISKSVECCGAGCELSIAFRNSLWSSGFGVLGRAFIFIEVRKLPTFGLYFSSRPTKPQRRGGNFQHPTPVLNSHRAQRPYLCQSHYILKSQWF